MVGELRLRMSITTIVSNAKIEASGFKTQVSLDTGIQELVKGFQIVRRNQYANV